MKKLLLAVSALLCITHSTVNAQNRGKCPSDAVTEQIFASNPELRRVYTENKEKAQERVNAHANAKSTATYKVPVVFHIVLTSATQSLSGIGGTAGIVRRIDSQMVVLNRDFQKKNGDSTIIPSVFKPLYGNANIEFALAHKKPNGHWTLGYEIITTTVSAFDPLGGTYGSGYFGSNVKYAASGGADAWDPTKYLNVWVTIFTDDNLLGVCTPRTMVGSGSPIPINEVGVLVNIKAFGKRTSGADLYLGGIDKGRTLTHEIGHYFDLDHIWGSSSTCSDDDGIGDTPKQDQENYNCPSGVLANCTSSSGGEMYMNYMDYVDDACMAMFSTGQCTHMAGYFSSTLTVDPNIFYFPLEVAPIAQDDNFEVYPNPSFGKFSVNFATAPQSLRQVTVTNMMGQQVFVKSAEANTAIYNIDISGMSKGVYFVQCHFAEGMVTRKIVVE